MTAISFDTLQFVQRLKKAGVKEAEAEAIAEAVRDVQTSADVATREDVMALKKDMAVVEARLEVKIAETKADLVRWVVGVGVLQTALIAAMLLKMLPAA